MAMHMYFVAIVLPLELNEKVLKWKQFVKEKWGCSVGLKSPAHITLVPPFWLEPEKEQRLLQDVVALSQCNPFTIRTKNFSAFRPRTIFIATEENEKLNALKKTIDGYFYNQNNYKVTIDTRPFHPHITIATRDL